MAQVIESAMATCAPATGTSLPPIEMTTPTDVVEMVQAARRVQSRWRHVPLRQRAECLRRLAQLLVRRADTLTAQLSEECGKPRFEALVHEVMVAADMARAWAATAPRALADEGRSTRLFQHRQAWVRYQPRGVVAVIAPWNYPLVIALSETMAAVVAGNAVVVKASEWSPRTVHTLVGLFADAGFPDGLVQVALGDGAVGEALIEARPDLVVFTGSVGVGRRIAARCGELLIPTLLELGGKAPAIVRGDAKLSQTAASLLWGAFVHSGQVCVSVERAYIARRLYAPLCDALVQRCEALRIGDPLLPDTDIGALTRPGHSVHLQALVEDALAKGARLLAGGAPLPGPGQRFAPTLLADCTHHMRVMREEIFGPILPLMAVESDREALALANDSPLGLAAYVYSSDRRAARGLAEALEAGVVVINEALIAYSMADLPFGGVKSSGIGRVHGIEGLRAMCQLQQINADRWSGPEAWVQFPYSAAKYARWQRASRWLFGGGR
ncbi:MAG: aldehyde dehydrogenase family protein [Polyangiales bacterium]